MQHALLTKVDNVLIVAFGLPANHVGSALRKLSGTDVTDGRNSQCRKNPRPNLGNVQETSEKILGKSPGIIGGSPFDHKNRMTNNSDHASKTEYR